MEHLKIKQADLYPCFRNFDITSTSKGQQVIPFESTRLSAIDVDYQFGYDAHILIKF